VKNFMEYRGFYGSVEFSDEDNVFFGRLIGINDRILFEGDSMTNLRNNFKEAVDDYFEICKNMGKELMFVSKTSAYHSTQIAKRLRHTCP